MPDIEHVNVKIFARQKSGEIAWADLIPVFHRWIQERLLPESLIDVADYAHVPAGPGVMLIAHEAFYSLDNREDRPGILYNRRAAMEGGTQDKLASAYDSALAAARLLEQAPEFQGKISFDERSCEVWVNDRLLSPPTDESRSALQSEIDQFFAKRFGERPQVAWTGTPRELPRARVQVGGMKA